jgi:hypothetical protein
MPPAPARSEIRRERDDQRDAANVWNQRNLLPLTEHDTRKEGRESRPSFPAYAKGDGQPAGSPVETRDAFTVHPPS